MGYITEALYGDYRTGSEDRLTQVFSASFNSSPMFRKAIFRHLGMDGRGRCRCMTQEAHRVGGRTYMLDICIKRGGRRLAVIENKVESKLTARQLENYNQISVIRSAKKFCFVRTVSPDQDYPKNWNIVFWSGVHSRLRSLNPQDFVTQNFIETLEEYDMVVPEKISGADLKRLGNALYRIRYGNPGVSLARPILETMVDYKAMLQEIWRRGREDERIVQRVGRSFHFTPGFGGWYEAERERGQRHFLQMGLSIRIARPHRGIKYLSTGIYFRDRRDWYAIETHVANADRKWLDSLIYRRRELEFADYAKQVLSFWRRKLR